MVLPSVLLLIVPLNSSLILVIRVTLYYSKFAKFNVDRVFSTSLTNKRKNSDKLRMWVAVKRKKKERDTPRMLE